MASFKAFVGHSFTQEDKDVVRIFLEYFDQVENLNIGFSWVHAESAEPRELAKKVKGLMEDKNLFIGICTRKEFTIASANLSRGILCRKTLKAREDQFLWKTSDWIVQEIGFAIGKGMELILLVESGLQRPGGLQGDLEYIEFDRHTPEKCFGKVLEMIRSLMPKAKSLAAEQAAIQTVQDHKQRDEEKIDEERYQPQPDWNRRRFEIAYLLMIQKDDEKGANSISQAYLSTNDGSNSQNRESWGANIEYIRLILGKGGQLIKLEEFAKVHRENSEVQRILGRGYQYYKEYEKAARQFKIAADNAGCGEQRISCYGDAAVAFSRAGLKAQAAEAIAKMRADSSKSGENEQEIVKSLRAIAEIENDKNALFGLTERYLDIDPSDTDVRFNLAHRYSEEGENELSLFHYLKVPDPERSSGTWNNLGVAYEQFDLASKSVMAYRKAEDLGETLAMSNLAQKLIKVGFLNEADEICKRAVKTEDYHKNVGYAISRIKEIPEAEDKHEKELLLKATPISAFYRDYGHAIAAKGLGDHLGRWCGPDCELQLTVKSNSFVAEGSFERSVRSLADLFQTPGAESQPRVIQHRVRYEGTVVGRSVKSLLTRAEEGGSSAFDSKLRREGKKTEVLMIVSESMQEIRAYEKSAAKDHKFYTLHRIE